MKVKNCRLIISSICLFIISVFICCNNNGVKEKDFYGLYRLDSLWYNDSSQRTKELISNYKSVTLILKQKDSFTFNSPGSTIAGTWHLGKKSKNYGLSFSVNSKLIFADFNNNYILFDGASPSLFDSVFQTVRLIRYDTDRD